MDKPANPPRNGPKGDRTDSAGSPASGSAADGGASSPATRVADDLAEPLSEAARFEARVHRAFIRDGRLVSIPAQNRKRRVILSWLVDACFTEDRAYPEREVNMRLALVHPDVAALRRYLVDAQLMTRNSGVYRRAVSSATPRRGAGPDAF